MEAQYEPRDWVEAATRGCSRLYLLNEDQYATALMRLRWESPLSSAEVRTFPPHAARLLHLVSRARFWDFLSFYLSFPARYGQATV